MIMQRFNSETIFKTDLPKINYLRIFNVFNRQLLTYQPVVDFLSNSRHPPLSMEITFWSSACPFAFCLDSSLTCSNCKHSINTPLNYEP